MNDRHDVTHTDFAAFVIMAAFFSSVFVAPFIVAAAYMDHALSCRASRPSVSMRSERSDARVSANPVGAVRMDGSHGVRRVPGPVVSVSWLSEAAQGLARSSSTLGETMMSAQGEAVLDGTPNSAMRLRAGGDGMRSSQRSAHGGAGDAIPSDSRSTGPCQTRAAVPNGGWQSTGQNNPCSGSVTVWRDRHQAFARVAAGLCGMVSSVDVSRFMRLIARESGWRHYGPDGEVLRSSSGALGLGQVKPATAQAFAPTDIREPFGNLLVSACLFQSYYQKRGSWREAVLDYRFGPYRRGTTNAARDYSASIMADGGAN